MGTLEVQVFPVGLVFFTYSEPPEGWDSSEGYGRWASLRAGGKSGLRKASEA